jgi:hypothetical protein
MTWYQDPAVMFYLSIGALCLVVLIFIVGVMLKMLFRWD